MRPAPLLLTLLLLPVAAAAPFAAELEPLREPEARGAARVEATAGALDLSQAARLGQPIRLLFEGASVERVSYRTRGVDGVWSDSPSVDPVERFSLGAGALERLACAGDCVVLLVARGDGRVGLEGRAAGALGWVERERLYCGHTCAAYAPHFQHAVAPGALSAGSEGLALRDAAPLAAGRVTLFLRNVTAEAALADGTLRALDARAERRPLAGVAAAGAFEGVERHVVVEASGVSLEAPPSAEALLMADEAVVRLDGALSSPSATGRIAFLGRDVAFEDEPLLVRANATYAVSTRAVPSALLLPPGLAVGVAADGAGDAEEVRVGARRLAEPPPAPGAALGVAGSAVGAGLLSLLLFPRALAPLYSRIGSSRVLASATRARLYELLRAEPGRTAADLRRRTGLGRMAVEHHLAMLEAHRFVLVRRQGRRRLYFPSDAAPEPLSVAQSAALADPTRRLVAAALVGGSGMTQRDLVAATGLSQRLVSYHLARLQASRLATAEGGLPRRYRAAPEAARLLAEASGRGS